MSVRTVVSRLFQNGRYIFEILRPQHRVVDFPKVKIFPRGIQAPEAAHLSAQHAVPNLVNASIQAHFQSARKLFVDNILKRVTNSLAADLRRRTAKKLLFGDSTPFFALVGVSLASGTGILTKEDEFEGVCWEIRDAVSRMRDRLQEIETISIEDVEGLGQLKVGKALAKGSNAVIYEAERKEVGNEVDQASKSNQEFSLAVKMMFNYDAESNAMSILRAMYRETVPLRSVPASVRIDDFEKSFAERIIRLPPHPNIVAMYNSFVDYIPDLPGSRKLYPDALPSRINPDGYGRNMSLFLLMKRYDTNLRDYINNTNTEIRDKILILTQILEGVSHMNRHNVAHRDLKSDNILLETVGDYAECPGVVITDFGCCLSDNVNGLSLPYKSPDTDRGGNAALMAPEVATAQPGLFSNINYSKSDVWAVGAIAYELFNGVNPFYQTNKETPALRNTTYTEEDLPALNENVPVTIAKLIAALLIRNPNKRPSAELAATVCQLYLWAPSAWLNMPENSLPSNSELLQWLLCLATKVLYQGHSSAVYSQPATGKQRTATEYQLIASFLHRIKLKTLRQALTWIQSV
ncbi:unnamed protein product [Bemisia tabaci]|uniref:non-specific serine/threonine protein kinase n=1 Tax=Bemisia tabaci TaxID=7038 RepID=A0A9P0A017_BEMTA|nr:unnamed protein product [Bemisia tabaci]